MKRLILAALAVACLSAPAGAQPGIPLEGVYGFNGGFEGRGLPPSIYVSLYDDALNLFAGDREPMGGYPYCGDRSYVEGLNLVATGNPNEFSGPGRLFVYDLFTCPPFDDPLSREFDRVVVASTGTVTVQFSDATPCVGLGVTYGLHPVSLRYQGDDGVVLESSAVRVLAGWPCPGRVVEAQLSGVPGLKRLSFGQLKAKASRAYKLTQPGTVQPIQP